LYIPLTPHHYGSPIKTLQPMHQYIKNRVLDMQGRFLGGKQTQNYPLPNSKLAFMLNSL